MIRINLLKSFTSGGGGGGNQFSSLASAGGDRDQLMIQSIKRLVILVLGPLALYIYESQAIPELQNKLNAINAEVTQTATFNQSKNGLAQEIKKYEEEQDKINKQMNFINKIARDKTNESKLFQHLYNSTPETVWINRLEFRDNVLSIDTESEIAEDLNKFSERLNMTEFLTNIIPTAQTYKIDPFGISVNTVTQNLKAQFNSEMQKQ
jgi:type IV pilus assembly protein PilN